MILGIKLLPDRRFFYDKREFAPQGSCKNHHYVSQHNLQTIAIRYMYFTTIVTTISVWVNLWSYFTISINNN